MVEDIEAEITRAVAEEVGEGVLVSEEVAADEATTTTEAEEVEAEEEVEVEVAVVVAVVVAATPTTDLWTTLGIAGVAEEEEVVVVEDTDKRTRSRTSSLRMTIVGRIRVLLLLEGGPRRIRGCIMLLFRRWGVRMGMAMAMGMGM